jgi:enoyl-[acyl-carrier protein] reductase I
MAQDLLKGKKGIIFGALNDMSIAWKVAEKAHEQGAEFVLTNTDSAIRLGSIHELAEKTNSKVIAADAANVDDLEALLTESMEHFGGKIDFILHSIGMSLNVRKKRPYDDLDYNYMMKSLDISAISFHKLLQSARKLDAINEWGSVIALSYIAAQRSFYGYNEMAEAKAMLESIARSFGYIYGRNKKIRVNTISQSPTLTTAGSGVKGINDLLDFSERMSPLGNASAEDCADYCIVMFSDFTKKVTMQNLYNDGGFSSVGMSWKAMQVYSKHLDEVLKEEAEITD